MRKIVEVSIKGKAPLLIHRFGEPQELNGSTRSRAIDTMDHDPRLEAEKCVYRSPEGWLYIPGTWISGTLKDAGSNHKMKGSRRSLRFIVPSAVLVQEDVVPLTDDQGTPLRDYEVDGRPVTIPSTKGRIMRYRPRLNDWNARFTLGIETDMMGTELVNQLLVEAGERMGIGDFRPSKSGPFGRFMVTRYAVMDYRLDGALVASR